MSRQLNPAQIWSQVPVANRLIEVNTKTGFSLTAGSYSGRASSAQRNAFGVTNGSTSATSSISSVTSTRTQETNGGSYTDMDFVQTLSGVLLTGATTLTARRTLSLGVGAVEALTNEFF